MPIFPQPRLNGYLIMSAEQGQWLKRVSWHSVQSTHGLSGTSVRANCISQMSPMHQGRCSSTYKPLQWDPELLRIFDIPVSLLPEVRSSSEFYGLTTGHFSTRIPVAGIAGDQQAALFGQMCVDQGMVKNTYGTGCFMVMNIGTKPIQSKNRLLTTVAWKIGARQSMPLKGASL